MIANGRVEVDGQQIFEFQWPVSRHNWVSVDSTTVQTPIPRLYFMLNKPIGVVSATRDEHHTTAIDILDQPHKNTLHIAGRLDRSSSGLLLLTNDSSWSEALTHPDNKVEKEYLVETVDPIPPEAVARFAEGFHFLPEDVVTKPAHLEILDSHKARVVLREGRYHQVKRMFHKVNQIRLVSLHRERIGMHTLPPGLDPGESRAITQSDGFSCNRNRCCRSTR